MLLTGACARWRPARSQPATVLRIWKKHKLQLHWGESFKFSDDPDFAPNVRDIVGLYLNLPDKAIVLSADKKSQIQALDRTQPILPLRPGLSERQTNDYKRHGTAKLFAALDVLQGTVIGECQPWHRQQVLSRFLDRIDQSIDASLDIHLIIDNYGTQKHTEVKKWLAERPRYHEHFTPTSSSWLNQIERWFAVLTRKIIRRGTFSERSRSDQSGPRLHPDIQQQSPPLAVGRPRQPHHPKG
jgi:transposase